MGDRAAIEKKANELLKDWRDEVLGTTDDQEKKNIVHSFTAWRMLYWDFTATHQPALNSNRRHTLAKTSDLDVRVQLSLGDFSRSFLSSAVSDWELIF